jgi:hypothetical protein
MDPGFAVAYGGLLYLKHLWETWKSHRFGIYGTFATGKTTLSRQLSTSGELEYIDPEKYDTSTQHPYDEASGKFILPGTTRKRIALANQTTLKTHRRTILSADLGGHPRYFDLWLEDMVSRNVEIVIWLIDHRHLVDSTDTSQQDMFSRFAQVIINNDYSFADRKLQSKAKKYKPQVVGLFANKLDVWGEDWDVHWGTPRMNRHAIFEPFVPTLALLQTNMIPTIKRSISALHNHHCEEAIWDLMQAKH